MGAVGMPKYKGSNCHNSNVIAKVKDFFHRQADRQTKI